MMKNKMTNITLDVIHGIWQSRNLTLFGRCLITKSLGISQLVHSTSILDIPKEYIQNVDTMIFKFIWKNKKDKINRKVMLIVKTMTTVVYARLA